MKSGNAMLADRSSFSSVPAPYGPFAEELDRRGMPVERFAELLLTLAPRADTEAQISFCEALRDRWGDLPLVMEVTGALLGRQVDQYHLRMIKDQPRNQSYATAIAHSVASGMTVLEIGTGGGLLAILAAKAGADHVYTVERRPVMAAIARRNIQRNGLSDRITVIEGVSTELKIGAQVPRRADVLLHELFGAKLVDEKVFRYIEHAKAELVADHAILLPERARLHGHLGSADKDAETFTDICGVDLGALSLLDAGKIAPRKSEAQTILTDATILAEFDLAADNPLNASSISADLTITADGMARSVSQWIGYSFPDGTTFENPPGAHSHWKRVTGRLPTPTPVRKGEIKTIHTHTSQGLLWFTLD